MRPVWAVLPFAAVVAALVILWLRQEKPSSGAAVPEGYHRFCLDLSHHNNADIAWDSLRVLIGPDGKTIHSIASAREIRPLECIVFKATEGISMQDSRFKEFWEAAGKLGIPRGAYHFFRTSVDPAVQAQNYIRTVALRHSDMPPILDVETHHLGCTAEQLNGRVKIWLETVEAHYGRRPLLYAPDSYVRDLLSRDITDNYPLWIARYNENAPVSGGWTLWQFTDKALVYGVKGFVDLSVIR